MLVVVQLEAYNARDLEAFMALLADDCVATDAVTGAVLGANKEELRHATSLSAAAAISPFPSTAVHTVMSCSAQTSSEEGVVCNTLMLWQQVACCSLGGQLPKPAVHSKISHRVLYHIVCYHCC